MEILFEKTWRTCKQLDLSSSPERKEEYLKIVTELAGAVAHELFQPLTAISINAELILRTMAPTDPGRKYVESLLGDIDRMVEMVGNLDRICRYETKPYLGETKILDLNKAVSHPKP